MEKKRKILTVVYDLDVGGTQRAAQNFAIGYKNLGYDSRVLPLYDKGLREEELVRNDVYVYDAFALVSSILREVIKWMPDVIHIHRAGRHEEIYSKLFRELPEDILVVETNVFSFVDNTKDSNRISIHFHLSRWCLWKWSLFAPKHSFGIVIPYLVLENFFYKENSQDQIDHFKKKYGIPQSSFLFGRIGQKSPAKFHPEIFRSFDKLVIEKPDIHLMLVGVPDSYLDELKSTFSYKSGRITVIEKIIGDDELRVAYNSFDCFLHISSIGESFGMVLAEAQLCETPILTLSTPKVDNSQVEVCLHQKTSIIAKDFSTFYHEMKKISSGSYDLKTMGKNGREHILNHYTPSFLMKRLDSVLTLALKPNFSQNEIKQFIGTKDSTPSVKDLRHIGVGSFSWSITLFFISPHLYLHLAYFANRVIKVLKGIKQ